MSGEALMGLGLIGMFTLPFFKGYGAMSRTSVSCREGTIGLILQSTFFNLPGGLRWAHPEGVTEEEGAGSG